QPHVEIPKSITHTGQTAVRIRAHLSRHHVKTVTVAAFISLDGQQKPEHQVSHYDERPGEEHAHHDDHSRDRDVESKIVRKTGAHAEDFAAARNSIQAIEGAWATLSIHCD